jgi:hypothetical protein
VRVIALLREGRWLRYQADLVVTCAPAEHGARAIAEPG